MKAAKAVFLLPAMVLSLALSSTAWADAVTPTYLHVIINTCQTCWGTPWQPTNLPEHPLDIVLTMIPGTGFYWDPMEQTQTMRAADVLEVINISGTMDGLPIGLRPGGRADGRSWVYKGAAPVGLLWMTGATTFWDGSQWLLGLDDSRQLIPIYSTRVADVAEVPEANSIEFLIAGLLSVGLVRKSLRRVSRRKRLFGIPLNIND